MTPLIAGLACVAVLRVAASFLVSRRTNAGPTLVIVACAAVLLFDLGRGFLGSPAAVVQLAAPFEGEWLVLQGGQSPLQSHHLSAYNQRFALDLVRLENNRIFADVTGNALSIAGSSHCCRPRTVRWSLRATRWRMPRAPTS